MSDSWLARMKSSLLVATLLLAAGCSSGGAVADAEVAAVYEALLLDHCCLEHAIVQEVTDSTGLSSPRAPSSEDEYLKEFSPEIHEAVDDLRARSRTVQRLPGSLRVTMRDRRLPADSVRAMLTRARHDHSERLPDSATVVLISGVGFSRDGRVAVVRMTTLCGPLCGSSTLRTLRKHPGGWVAAEEIQSVVS